MTRLVALAAAVQLSAWAGACQPAESMRAGSSSEFGELPAANEPVDLNTIDYPLLAEAIFHETNGRRSKNDLEALEHLPALDRASCGHAEAMVEQDFFAHRNPGEPGLETPADRVRAQGLELRVVAENIAEVFGLRYQSGERVYLRREDGRTLFSKEPGGEPLGLRSYLEIAETLLDGWMSSEGHRANILSRRPEYFGSGCELGRAEEEGMPMFVCVQLFFSPL
ncbi:MAG: CAP domain-containing protein [Trueperaceae bacterium]